MPFSAKDKSNPHFLVFYELVFFQMLRKFFRSNWRTRNIVVCSCSRCCRDEIVECLKRFFCFYLCIFENWRCFVFCSYERIDIIFAAFWIDEKKVFESKICHDPTHCTEIMRVFCSNEDDGEHEYCFFW